MRKDRLDQHGNTTQGYLVHKRSERIVLPRIVDALCVDFVQRGFGCSGHYRTCRKGKHLGYKSLCSRDKETINVFLGRN